MWFALFWTTEDWGSCITPVLVHLYRPLLSQIRPAVEKGFLLWAGGSASIQITRSKGCRQKCSAKAPTEKLFFTIIAFQSSCIHNELMWILQCTDHKRDTQYPTQTKKVATLELLVACSFESLQRLLHIGSSASSVGQKNEESEMHLILWLAKKARFVTGRGCSHFVLNVVESRDSGGAMMKLVSAVTYHAHILTLSFGSQVFWGSTGQLQKLRMPCELCRSQGAASNSK